MKLPELWLGTDFLLSGLNSTLWEQRVLFFALIYSRQAPIFDLQDLANLLGISEHSCFVGISARLAKLKRLHVFPAAQARVLIVQNVDLRKGKLKVEFTKEFINFSRSRKQFAKIDLKALFKLDSIYAFRFYQLFCVAKINERIRELKFSIEDLHFLLQTPESYKNFARFEEKVLEAAKRGLEEKEIVKLQWKKELQGRRVSALTLQFRA